MKEISILKWLFGCHIEKFDSLPKSSRRNRKASELPKRKGILSIHGSLILPRLSEEEKKNERN